MVNIILYVKKVIRCFKRSVQIFNLSYPEKYWDYLRIISNVSKLFWRSTDSLLRDQIVFVTYLIRKIHLTICLKKPLSDAKTNKVHVKTCVFAWNKRSDCTW